VKPPVSPSSTAAGASARDQIAPDLRKLAAFLDARTTLSDPKITISNARMTIPDARKTLTTASAVMTGEATDVEVKPIALPPVLDERLELLREPTSDRAAAYRVLAHRLLDRHDARVVAVASPNRGEGKTSCAVNVAFAMAEKGRKVLLVEACVHTPALAGLFGFQPPWCFSQQLLAHRQQPLLAWSVAEILGWSVHVAAVHPETPEPPLLDAVAFEIATERLRLAGYDVIVIDAPSVLGGIEANLVQDAADGTLLVARKRRTRGRHVRRAVEQLTPGTLFGLALME
jgi:Mrp family chromosome partitioning ATPase